MRASARCAGAALAKVAPQIAALSEEELRAKLRVCVLPLHAPAQGLVTCARPITKRFALRLVATILRACRPRRVPD